jgi:molecular chaperone GrpE
MSNDECRMSNAEGMPPPDGPVFTGFVGDTRQGAGSSEQGERADSLDKENWLPAGYPLGGSLLPAWPDTDLLLERFRAWLSEFREEGRAAEREGGREKESNLPCSELPAPSFGLLDVVREFTALRHEVKLQTKSARGLEERAAAAVAALEEASRQFRAVEPKEAEAARAAAVPLIEALADLDESLGRAQAMAEAARGRLGGEARDTFSRSLADLFAAQPAWKRWLCRAWHARVGELCRTDAEDRLRIVDSLAEGYGLVRKRLERTMAKEGVYRLATVGLPVDPHAMTVVEVVDDGNRAAGTVVEEIRPGYRWNEKVIRFAEVRAVRYLNEEPNSQEEN